MCEITVKNSVINAKTYYDGLSMLERKGLKPNSSQLFNTSDIP